MTFCIISQIVFNISWSFQTISDHFRPFLTISWLFHYHFLTTRDVGEHPRLLDIIILFFKSLKAAKQRRHNTALFSKCPNIVCKNVLYLSEVVQRCQYLFEYKLQDIVKVRVICIHEEICHTKKSKVLVVRPLRINFDTTLLLPARCGVWCVVWCVQKPVWSWATQRVLFRQCEPASKI